MNLSFRSGKRTQANLRPCTATQREGDPLAGSAEASWCERVSRLGPTGTLQERSDPTQLTSLYNRTETILPDS